MVRRAVHQVPLAGFFPEPHPGEKTVGLCSPALRRHPEGYS